MSGLEELERQKGLEGSWFHRGDRRPLSGAQFGKREKGGELKTQKQ